MPSQIQKLKNELEQLKKLVHKDPLTGVYNRRGFLEWGEKFFESAIKSSKYSGRRKNYMISSLSLVFCDLDDFKKVNDEYGHLVGDKVLKTASSLMAGSLRVSDLICRWGGEEFAIMLVGANLKDAFKIAENLRKNLAKKKILIDGKKFINITASFGVAEIAGAKNLDDLILKADKAMYKAKKQGKNRVVSLRHY